MASRLVEQGVQKPRVDRWKHKEGHNYGEMKEDARYDYDISGLSCDEHHSSERFPVEVKSSR